MKFHAFTAPGFAPTNLQPAPEGSGAYSHATTLLAEAAQRIRQRERETVRGALAAVGGRDPAAKAPTETEAFGFFGQLVESLAAGPDALAPYTAQARWRLGQYFGADPDALPG